MDKFDLYRDIATRTGGDIYVGVVGPVRTGKSTVIKQFMEKLVVGGIEGKDARARAVDEIPQSAEAKKYIPGGVQHSRAFNKPFPMCMTKAEGA